MYMVDPVKLKHLLLRTVHKLLYYKLFLIHNIPLLCQQFSSAGSVPSEVLDSSLPLYHTRPKMLPPRRRHYRP